MLRSRTRSEDLTAMTRLQSEDCKRGQVIDCDQAVFREQFGRLPFALRHNLIATGLFTTERLAVLVEKMIATGYGNRVSIFEGTQKSQLAGAGFEHMKSKKPFADAVLQLETSNCWIDLFRLNEIDPEFDAVCQALIADASALLGAPDTKDAQHCQMNIFLSSPRIVTPYHYDHPQNFLCQIAGEKDVWLWNPADRENLTDLAIERFYSGDTERKRRLDFGRGEKFHIGPGDALHQPALAPHWVQNGSNISISVGIGFSTAVLYRSARIYQANAILRGFGLKPPSPGSNAVLDSLRSGIVSAFSKRSPKSMNDALFSGFNRIQKNIKRASTALRGVRKGASPSSAGS